MREARIRKIPDKIWDRLKIHAIKQRRTVNELVVMILTEWVRRNK